MALSLKFVIKLLFGLSSRIFTSSLLELSLVSFNRFASAILAVLNFEKALGFDNNLYDEVINLYDSLELPYKVIDYKGLLKDVHFDKKNIAGNVNFVFVNKIGEAFIYKLEEKAYESFN